MPEFYGEIAVSKEACKKSRIVFKNPKTNWIYSRIDIADTSIQVTGDLDENKQPYFVIHVTNNLTGKSVKRAHIHINKKDIFIRTKNDKKININNL